MDAVSDTEKKNMIEKILLLLFFSWKMKIFHIIFNSIFSFFIILCWKKNETDEVMCTHHYICSASLQKQHFFLFVFDRCFIGSAIQSISYGEWSLLKKAPWVNTKEPNEQVQTLYDFRKLNENAFGTYYEVTY